MLYRHWRAAALILAQSDAGSSIASCFADRRLKTMATLSGYRLSDAYRFGMPGWAPSGPMRWAVAR
jgi:hypothetical protein